MCTSYLRFVSLCYTATRRSGSGRPRATIVSALQVASLAAQGQQLRQARRMVPSCHQGLLPPRMPAAKLVGLRGLRLVGVVLALRYGCCGFGGQHLDVVLVSLPVTPMNRVSPAALP